MRESLHTRRAALLGVRPAYSREGRDCERCRRITAQVLFPGPGSVPGAWLVLLAAACTFVAVRALELGGL